MRTILGMIVLLADASGFAFAGGVRTPEIDAASAAGAFALLTGGLLIIRARKK